MVSKENIYLFAGQDTPSKENTLEQIKSKFLKKEALPFDFNVLFAKDLSVIILHENLFSFPAGSEKRIVVLRNCHELKKDVKEFLIKYSLSPQPQTILVLDFERYDSKEDLIAKVSAQSTVIRFKQEYQENVFDLANTIKAGKAAGSLSILNGLLKRGFKPELILGGLRSSIQKETGTAALLQKKSKLFLECDIAIKTGLLKPAFALEKLVVSLCSLKKFPA